MAKPRTRAGDGWRGIVVICSLVVFLALALGGAGCSRNLSDYSQYPPNAEGIFLTGIKPPGGDADRLLRNAHYLKLMGRPEMGLRELEAAYQQAPKNIKVLNALALACDEMGEFSRAQTLYQEALALDASNQALNNNLCFSYYLAGQWDQAETCFRQAVKRNPQNIMARNNLGLLLCRRGRAEEARRLWEEAEGKAVAQKKMEQVMVALGGGDASQYARLPALGVPLPSHEATTPVAKLDQDATSAQVAMTSKPAPAASRAPATPPAPVSASLTPPAPPASPKSAPLAAASPAPPRPREFSAPVRPEVRPAPPAPAAAPAPAMEQKPPVPPSLAASPPPPQSPPAPPKRIVDTEKKPTPARTPPPPPKPGKIKLTAAPPTPKAKPEKPALSGIEVANATGAANLARQTRARLKEQGFHVVTISNNHGRRSDDTVIYYLPEAEQAARALSAGFFPQSRLEIGEHFARNTNIKVVLGCDFLASESPASKPLVTAEKIAAGPAPDLKKSPPPAAAKAAPVAAPPSRPAPVKAAARPDSGSSASYLTARELLTLAIEIRNGSGASNLAHRARSLLSQEGFNVARIGNHIDFGADNTIIYYRPQAEKMARNLSDRFFSHSRLEETANLSADIDVKVLLGKDLLQRTEVMAKLDD